MLYKRGQPTIEIRRLAETDAETFYKFRLRALISEPRAFGESAEEWRRNTVEDCAARLPGGAESFVVGAFDGGDLVGTVGFFREQRAKRRHKGHIWGVFVAEPHRGRGISRALMTAAIAQARTLDGLLQVQLSVGATQAAARALYASLGFRSYGIEPQGLRVDGEFVDEEQMVLSFVAEGRPGGTP